MKSFPPKAELPTAVALVPWADESPPTAVPNPKLPAVLAVALSPMAVAPCPPASASPPHCSASNGTPASVDELLQKGEPTGFGTTLRGPESRPTTWSEDVLFPKLPSFAVCARVAAANAPGFAL